MYINLCRHLDSDQGPPPCQGDTRETLDPKSSASTNSATGADAGAKVRISEQIAKLFD